MKTGTLIVELNINRKMKEKEMDKAVGKALDGFRAAAVEIVNLFAEKHGFREYDDRDVYFVDEFCDICMFGDYSFGMQTMMESLRYDLPAEELLKWYDYSCEYGSVFGSMEGCYNFKSWCSGCPRIDLAPIREKKEELDKMIREARETRNGF